MSWQKAFLTEISTVTTGKWDANHAVENGMYRFYTCANQHLYSDTKRYSGKNIILPGNGANVGDVYFYDGEFDAYQRTYVISDIKIVPEYLYYHLLCNWEKRNRDKQFGSATNFLKIGNFKDYEIAFPSLSTQQKIVEKLDAIFAEIDKATDAAEANIKNAELLFQSYLTEIFDGKNYELIAIPIGEIGEIIPGSGFPVNEQGLLKEEIPFYKVSDMNLVGNEKLMISHNNSISRETAKQLGAKIIPAKSVIFPKIGGAIATNKKRVLSVPSFVDNNVMGIAPNEKLVNPDFFFHLLSSIELSSFANEAALPSIKKSTVEERVVRIPKSLSEQERICVIVDSLKSNSSLLIDSYSRKLKNLFSLKQSILSQAFSGQLVKE